MAQSYGSLGVSKKELVKILTFFFQLIFNHKEFIFHKEGKKVIDIAILQLLIKFQQQ